VHGNKHGRCQDAEYGEDRKYNIAHDGWYLVAVLFPLLGIQESGSRKELLSDNRQAGRERKCNRNRLAGISATLAAFLHFTFNLTVSLDNRSNGIHVP
jgi:hypothetical protein